MSSVRLSGNVSGTGVFTVTSPNSNNSPTMTLPDATTTLVGTDATQSFTNKSFNSASVPTVSGTAPLYFCRAWVNFNGTGTVAIRASGNVTSITDNGPGDYTVNFTTAMPDANYSVAGTSTDFAATFLMQISPALIATPLLTSSAQVQSRATSSGAVRDVDLNSVQIFR